MSYLNEVDAWLEESGITNDDTKREIKGKILESYRNGRRDSIKYLYGVLKNMSNGKKDKNENQEKDK